MRNRRVASIAFAGAAVAAVGTVMNTGVAHAAGTKWTTAPGGLFTASAGAASFKDVTAGLTLKCTSAKVTGSISKTTFTQTTSASVPVGKISGGTFGSVGNACSGGPVLAFDATFRGATIRSYTPSRPGRRSALSRCR